MDSSVKCVNASLGELFDRLTIDQIKEVLNVESRNSYAQEMKHLEDDINLFFKKPNFVFDVYIIRLVIALAQINLHIWQTKTIMQNDSSRFDANMKLAHQLNGVRNFLKSSLAAEGLSKPGAFEKTNLDTDHLKGWDFQILQGRNFIKNQADIARKTISDFTKKQYSFVFGDLVDCLTIAQIKEALLPESKRDDVRKQISEISWDIDHLMKEKKINPTARLMRFIIFLAQANLHVWFNKDRMQIEDSHYYDLLEFAQELNGLRNFIKNIILEETGEHEASQKRVTFLKNDEKCWYSAILKGLHKAERMPVSNFSLDDFSGLFGISSEDLPPACRDIIVKSDFRHRKMSTMQRDNLIVNVFEKIQSADLTVAGAHRYGQWEKGWAENLEAYQKSHDSFDLTPKFIKSGQPIRLKGDFVIPFSDRFEFDFVDVLRQWLFLKFFKEVGRIYEFGCGSCQHLSLLANMFCNKKITGLDWATSSIEIIKELNSVGHSNLDGILFNLLQPNDNVKLDSGCGVFTVGTLEQLGKNFDPFLNYLLSQPVSVCFHLETIKELYDENNLSDYLALKFDARRGYLDGFLSRLRELEVQKKIEIFDVKRIYFGSLYHDSYSLVAWRPKT